MDTWAGPLLIAIGHWCCPQDVHARTAFRRIMKPEQQKHVARTMKLQIIVAGLLTTSTYPAVFLPVDNRCATTGCILATWEWGASYASHGSALGNLWLTLPLACSLLGSALAILFHMGADT